MAVSSEKVVPNSYLQKLEYKNKIESIKNKQMDEFNKRVEANKIYAKTQTEKLIMKYKKFKEEEEKKIRDPETFYVPAEPKFLVVVLIRSKQRVGPKARTTLDLLRLNVINSCVIVRNNKSIKNMLALVKDYVAFGYLDYQMLRKLIYTRGFAKVGSTKVKLTNEVIEDAFEGKYRCIEDLVYNIYFGCEDIQQILKLLWPFRLSCPVGGFPGRKSMNFMQGGCTNNHKELLYVLLDKMI